VFLRFKNILGAEKGLTLVELIIASSLILLVLSISYSIYLFGIQGYLDNAAVIENQSNVRIALEHITYNIGRSKEVKITGDTLMVGSESYRLSKDILMNKDNQLAVGISEFVCYKPKPSLLYIEILSVPDRQGDNFSLEAYFYLYE
jgi:prepilin-type N-terminal cleavage/methylation domain-containing protein